MHSHATRVKFSNETTILRVLSNCQGFVHPGHVSHPHSIPSQLPIPMRPFWAVSPCPFGHSGLFPIPMWPQGPNKWISGQDFSMQINGPGGLGALWGAQGGARGALGRFSCYITGSCLCSKTLLLVRSSTLLCIKILIRTSSRFLLCEAGFCYRAGSLGPQVLRGN